MDLLQLMINAHKEEGSKLTPDTEDESYEKCREMGLYFTFTVLYVSTLMFCNY